MQPITIIDKDEGKAKGYCKAGNTNEEMRKALAELKNHSSSLQE